MNTDIFIGLFLPFAGTSLGAALVFFSKNQINGLLQKTLLGFASGVMMAASVWSLLIPSMEMAQDSGMGRLSFLPAVIGFSIGIVGLIIIDRSVPHLHLGLDVPEGPRSNLRKTSMMILAVTIHNLPEGMAVGAIFAGALANGDAVSYSAALALSIGIAIQNFPEGAIISLPLAAEGQSKRKSFIYGVLSGAVEPIGAIITILLSRIMIPFLPYLLSFAAGAMIYVTVEETIPEASEGSHSNLATVGFAVGFMMMMVLDTAFG